MDIHAARENTTHVMNAKSIIYNIKRGDDLTLIGESRNVILFCLAYYGGFNVADEQNFTDLRRS